MPGWKFHIVTETTRFIGKSSDLKAYFAARVGNSFQIGQYARRFVCRRSSPSIGLKLVADIRRRDLERLRQQVDEGIMAGSDKLHIRPVQPEPLSLD